MSNVKDKKSEEKKIEEKTTELEVEKDTDEKEKKKGKGGIIALAIVTVLLIAGGGYGFYLFTQFRDNLTTDNARITTTLVSITSSTPGRLERFNVTEGQVVTANEVIGWVENGETLYAPFDGLVVQANAVQNQVVSPMEVLAVIADINNIHVQANIEETDISRVELGRMVNVTVDGLQNQSFRGYIAEIGSVTDAELTGMAMFFNTGGNFTRVTHLLPVRVNFVDDINPTNLIGTNARVQIDTSAVNTDRIRTEAIAQGTSVAGVIQSSQSRNVYSTTGLQIEHIYVEVGDTVTQGQVLATLDTENLELTIAQQRAMIATTRQNSQAQVQDTNRMLAEARSNLANNTNMQILNAEANLVNAEIALQLAQENYDNAMQDMVGGINPMVVHAESLYRNAGMYLHTREVDYANVTVLYGVGAASAEQLRLASEALIFANAQMDDARINLINATDGQDRTMEQLTIALQAAQTAYQNAHTLLEASRVSAQQDIARLTSTANNAQIGTNLEHMEITLAMLENQLNDATIRAEAAGTITARHVAEGANAIGLLFTIEDTHNLRVITSFREHDLRHIYQGKEVSVITDHGNGVVHMDSGVITRINPVAMPNPMGIVEFETEVSITSTNPNLLIGMNTRVYID